MLLLKKLFKANTLTTGLAMFAMFFGSGNLIFPVSIGKIAGGQTIYAILGLFITAVFLPFATLCLMLFINGDYELFFNRIGVVPGKIIAFMILALIGPFGVLPRCIAFSHSTFSIYFHNVSLLEFVLVSSLIIFLCSIKTTKVVGIIGNFFTPILLMSLAVMIFTGLRANHIVGPEIAQKGVFSIFFEGFIEGYKTLDIFAALFFASAIVPAFQNLVKKEEDANSKKELFFLALGSSLIGMVLLLTIYTGLSFVSANLRGGLMDVPSDKLLGTIATFTLGNTAGLFSNLVVSLSCLTTAISLAVVSAEFFQREVFLQKVSYFSCLVLTMVISVIFALLGFDGIMRLVIPFLMVLYPAVIALVIATIIEKFSGFSLIKISFYSVLTVSFAVNFLL